MQSKFISFLEHKKSEEVRREEAEKEADNNEDDNINN
jgi:F0F1-type ATP synthase gamma subunit